MGEDGVEDETVAHTESSDREARPDNGTLIGVVTCSGR